MSLWRPVMARYPLVHDAQVPRTQPAFASMASAVASRQVVVAFHDAVAPGNRLRRPVPETLPHGFRIDQPDLDAGMARPTVWVRRRTSSDGWVWVITGEASVSP